MLQFNIDRFNLLENEQIDLKFIEYAHEQEKHTHVAVEIVYVVEGSGEHIIDGKKIKAKRGTLIILDRDCVHSFINIEPMKYYNIMFMPSYLSDKLKSEDNISNLFEVYNVKTERKFFSINFEQDKIKDIEKIFFEMMQEGINKDLCYMDMVHKKFGELMIHILRNCSFNNEEERQEHKNDVFDNVFEYIFEHCCENPKLEDVADYFGYESVHFSKEIKKRFGCSYKPLVIKCKLDKAMTYIWTGQGTIDEILLKCGFSNKTYFYEVFEKYYGTKPKHIMKYSKNYKEFVKEICKKI